MVVHSLALRSLQRHLQQTKPTQCVLKSFKRLHCEFSLKRANSRPALHIFSNHDSVFNTWSFAPKRFVSVAPGLCSKSNSGKSENAQVSVKNRSSGHSTTRKVKEAGKDFTYLIVVLIGIGVTGGLLYVVFSELFSSSSPSKIYGRAYDKCRSNPEVIGAFGEPIKGFGETTRRGRRQQVSHVEYMKDGEKHMRLKFYIQGSEPGRRGTVHTESRENPETGKYEFRYVFVEVDTYPRRTIVIEDNR